MKPKKTSSSRKKKQFKIQETLGRSDLEIINMLDSSIPEKLMDQLTPYEERLAYSSSHKKTISIRLPEYLTLKLKEIARRKGIGYQPLIRMWLIERLEEELEEEQTGEE